MKPAENYILKQPNPFKDILLHLQVIIEQNFPEVDLQFKWKIPFYMMGKQAFCYLNPSHKKGFVDVGIYATEPFDKYNEFLISEGRKKVKSLRYFSIEDIDSNVLIHILAEAYEKNTQKD